MSVYGRVRSSWIAKLLVKVFRLEIIGAENEPANAPYMVCANHISNYDPIITGLCVKTPISYMAKAELFRIPVVSSIIKAFGAYPVERNKANISSIKATISLLENGAIVGMFPQGRRSKGINPEETTFKSGFALIAGRAKVGVLPITIIAKDNKLRLFRKTRAVIGEFIPYEDTQEVKTLNDKVFNAVMENYRKYKF